MRIDFAVNAQPGGISAIQAPNNQEDKKAAALQAEGGDVVAFSKESMALADQLKDKQVENPLEKTNADKNDGTEKTEGSAEGSKPQSLSGFGGLGGSGAEPGKDKNGQDKNDTNDEIEQKKGELKELAAKLASLEAEDSSPEENAAAINNLRMQMSALEAEIDMLNQESQSA